jgi:hypothetical protein
MDKRIERIGQKLGAKHVTNLPDFGGGAFGMSRLAQILHAQLAPSAGKRPGRPTNDRWTERCKVPMSADTLASLQAMSSRLSNEKRKVSPMQLAAQLLEESVLRITDRNNNRGRRKAAPAKR